ncbi:MAG TPA: autotransporter domain-containing protein, partial [Pseudoxanthomonas sp.]|nr:autotransporter domain-containing protein [Pseudoxanthomonas sp.]
TIEVDGFTEGNPSSTALVYSDQEVDSLIASAGWQASYAINDSVRPYARVTYDRELENPAEQVFAQVQTLPGVAPYAVPGLDLDRKYATVLLGARTRAFGLEADIGLTSTVGQKSGKDVTAFITLGGSF